jgi:signal transduction histidine kinase
MNSTSSAVFDLAYDFDLRPYDLFITSVVNEFFHLQTFIFENKFYFIYFVLLLLVLVCFWIIFVLIIMINEFQRDIKKMRSEVHKNICDENVLLWEYIDKLHVSSSKKFNNLNRKFNALKKSIDYEC